MKKFKLATATLAMLALCTVGCRGSNTKKAYEESQKVARESRRVGTIPANATKEDVEWAMGRRPDEVRNVGKQEVYYYLIQGAVDGEALRIVFEDGKMVDRQVVQMKDD